MSFEYSGTFTITAVPSINVTSPSTSTVLYVGDTHNITWSTTGTVGDLKIELYDGSNTKTAILTSNTGNDGNFSWTVTSSQLSGSDDEYQIKISELDGTPVDYSSNFRIWAYKWKQASDGLSYSETITPSVETFKTVKTALDTLGVTETITPADRTWRIDKTTSDTTAITETITSADRTWRIDKTTSDTTAITEAVQPWIVFQPKPTDSLTVSESVPTPTTRTWRLTYTPGEALAVSETIPTPTTRTWKNIQAVSDSIDLTEDVKPWIVIQPSVTEALAVTESVPTPTTRTWRPSYSLTEALAVTETTTPLAFTFRTDKTGTDGLSITDTIPTPTVRTWRKDYIPGEALAVTETTTDLTRTWRKDYTPGDALAVTEIATDLTRTWRKDYTPTETLAVTETATDLTRTWRKDYIPTEGVGFNEAVLTATRTWHHKVSEVLSVTEEIADIYGVSPDDGIAFVESVIPAIFHSCKVRKFQSVPTESYGTIHKTGWFTVSDSLTRTNILRRLNVEYNSADPLNVKIYVDGDDENPVFTHTLAAATDDETTNKSVRISRRAKSLMLELGTDASTNTNVTVEDIEVEVDDA